jgi:hypothetical protein
VPRNEEAVIVLVRTIHGGSVLPTPEWLLRPGKQECARRWQLVRRTYAELTGLELPDEMPSCERRQVDCVLQRKGEPPRIVEFDETQHFNAYRATTLRLYPSSVALSFDKEAWIAQSLKKRRLEGGGFGRPKPPLFPGDGGRHRQRAFRDALCDPLPEVHGYRAAEAARHYRPERKTPPERGFSESG